MSETGMFDGPFFGVFGAWFNVDLIDLTNAKEVKTTAGVCASDLMKKYPNPDKLIAELQDTLAHWNSNTVTPFMNATDTDWLFDQETEQVLKDIISEIIEGLIFFRKGGTPELRRT
jgi:hypothetical protein